MKNFSEIRNSDSPTLAEVKILFNEPVTVAIVNHFVIELVLFFNTTNVMNEQQVATTSKLICDEYFYFKPEHFKLFNQMAMKGKFGQVFNRVDGQVILLWLEQFSNDVAEYFEDNQNKHHTEIKKEPINYDMVNQFHAANPNYMERNKKDIEAAYSRFKADRMRDEINKEDKM